jgi:hypothetical protein
MENVALFSVAKALIQQRALQMDCRLVNIACMSG